MMWDKSTSLSLLFLVLISLFDSVAAYGFYGPSWYIYLIVIFVIIAISSCIGAWVRHRRNQIIVQRIQGRNQTMVIATAPGGVNPGYATAEVPNQPYPGYNHSTLPSGAPVAPSYGIMQPPAYEEPKSNTKDPNMPPAYEDAVNAPSVPDPGPNATRLPYPTQQPPYPTQPAAAYPSHPSAPQ